MGDADPDLDELLQRAFRYALLLTHHRALAEDLVQEACVAIARRGGPWQIGYLMTAVRNKYIDHCRRDGVLKMHPLGEIDVPDDGDPQGSISPVAAELSDDLEHALSRLKPGERELVYLSAVEECTMQQIATITGRPLGTVLSATHRAKEKLRQWLAAAQKDDGMTDQPDKLDEQIRRHYAAQLLGMADVDRLKGLIATNTAVRRAHRWPRYAAAAAVLLAIGISLQVWRVHSAANFSQALAEQMVQQHGQPFTPQFAAEDFTSLKSSMVQLAFTPIEPQRCKQDDYRIVGARYATLAGQKVAQIRLAYVDGPPLTLYEMRRDQFPNLREGKMTLDNVPVTIWSEGDLMMALAGTPVE